jgi:hypothetical protein
MDDATIAAYRFVPVTLCRNLPYLRAITASSFTGHEDKAFGYNTINAYNVAETQTEEYGPVRNR